MAKSVEAHVYPQSLDAERAVLGAVLIEPPILPRVLDVVQPTDFYLEAHRLILSAMIELLRESQEVDILALQLRLEQRRELERIGGPSTLTHLMDGCPVTVGVIGWATTIREHSIRRTLIEQADTIRDAAFRCSGISDLHTMAISTAKKAEPPSLASSTVSFGTAISELCDYQRKAITTGSGSPIHSPWPGLDALLGGGFVRGKRPYVFGGRRKTGKTQVGLAAALTSAKAGHLTLYWSVELNRKQWTARATGLMTGINADRIEKWLPLSDVEADRVMQAYAEVPQDLYVDASSHVDDRSVPGACRLSEIEARMDKLEETLGRKVEMLVMDYWQLVQTERWDRVHGKDALEATARAFQSLCLRRNLVGIALVQLLAKNQDDSSVPTASSIAGSDEFGRASSACIILDRPSGRLSETEREAMSDIERRMGSMILDLSESSDTGSVLCDIHPDSGAWIERRAVGQNRGRVIDFPRQDLPPESYDLQGIRWEND